MAWIPSDSFGTRLRIVRHQKRLSAEQIGEVCGVTKSTVGDWERGSNPKNMAQIVLKISEATGVDRDWLMFGTDAYDNDPFSQAFSRDAGIPELTLFDPTDMVCA